MFKFLQLVEYFLIVESTGPGHTHFKFSLELLNSGKGWLKKPSGKGKQVAAI